MTGLFLEEVCSSLLFEKRLRTDGSQTLDLRPSEKLQLARASADTQGDVSGRPDPTESDNMLPLRSVLTRPIVIAVSNYAMLALLCAVVESFTPLVWSTPIEFGGLGLSPAAIGLWLSMYGSMNGVFQLFFFPGFVNRFGPRLVFVLSIISCALNYTLFPFENLAAIAGGGPNHIIVCLLIILQMLALCFFDMGYGALSCVGFTQTLTRHPGVMYMYISSAAPNKRSLGAAYGLAQVASSVQSVLGPAAAGQLFSFSLTHNVLGGNFQYVVLVGAACVALGTSTQLPRNTWAHQK